MAGLARSVDRGKVFCGPTTLYPPWAIRKLSRRRRVGHDRAVSIDRLAPALRPNGRPGGFQRWRHLLFLHWTSAVDELAATLPSGLTLDSWEGKAYVGVVAFTMRDVSPSWAPPLRPISDFHELNLRTYVVADGVPGVWFYSLDAASRVAVSIARRFWGLPYHHATMQLTIDGDDVRYRSERKRPPPTPATFSADYRVGAERACAAAGTLDHFLVERYVLYAASKSGGLRRGRVHHEPYPLRTATVARYAQSMTSAAALPIDDGAPLVHYSPGVDVDVFDLESL
jgi:uncharacterized protein YqjF (DUF2071 family)